MKSFQESRESNRTSPVAGGWAVSMESSLAYSLRNPPRELVRVSRLLPCVSVAIPFTFLHTNPQLTKGEPVKDTARVLGADLDGIVARVFSHSTLVEFAKYSGISDINGLSDLEHPTQAVSDFSTISEVKGRLKGLKLAYIGDGDSVCNSLMLVATMTGMNFSVACPQGYEPNEKILAESRSKSKSSGSSIEITNDPKKAAAEADVLYTDVWVSIGEESESEKRMKAFTGFQINNELLQQAKQDAVVMHCLPAHRGLEITDDETRR